MTQIRIGRVDVEIDGAQISLAGRIDESANLVMIVPRIAAGAVAIDTAGVTFINSTGMREWLRLIRALRAEQRLVILERVADILMTQMNLIPELATSVEIRSFHAQYVCPACGAEPTPIVDAIAHGAALRAMRAPALPCPECGAAMELADFPERYLTIFGTVFRG